MSEIISEDERANAKLAQLNAVYSKAVDVTLGSVGPNDIEKVFGDIKGDFGASMSGALVQTLGRTRDRLESKYNDLIESYGIASHLQQESASAGQKESAIVAPVESTVRELAELEEEHIKQLIEKLERDNTELYQKKEYFLHQLEEQLAAVRAEESQLRMAANQML
mmetsp:Transcript_10052/g.15216  ORF Transcript_10052/g.15216 Transcript_10052/m.15216 type:complete len:166 (+) Transcript_10052:74-571(+)